MSAKEQAAPQTKLFIQYDGHGGEMRSELIDWERWRFDKSSGEYLICHGEENFYRAYHHGKRCRASDGGLSGLLGGKVDYPELKLANYLSSTVGRDVTVTAIEINDASKPPLRVTYKLGEPIEFAQN